MPNSLAKKFVKLQNMHIVKCIQESKTIEIKVHYVRTMHSKKTMSMHTMPSSEHACDTNAKLTCDSQ